MFKKKGRSYDDEEDQDDIDEDDNIWRNEDEDTEYLPYYDKYIKSNSRTHFIHTLLLGSPGCGKTALADILVDLWTSINIIDKFMYRFLYKYRKI